MTVLLVIIYISFISLGLPDSLLGSAWPSMYGNLGVSIASAGIVSMVVAGGTIVSSLFSDRVIKRFGTGRVTFVSVLMTAVALMGVSYASAFWVLCVWAIPLGLGAGSVDAGLNNFVALHYKAKHMSWLHCFWGIGASAGPLIMSYALVQRNSWNIGFRTVSIIQFVLVGILLVSLPLWKKVQEPVSENGQEPRASLGIAKLVRLPKAKPTLVAFFCYCATESTVGLWGSSYLVTVRGVAAETAASWISLYYFGITTGRFVSGFLSMKLTHKQMVYLGELLIGVGIAILFLPFSGFVLLAGFFFIGLGCAPIFPSLLHATPNNFGSEHSQEMMGVQMACAYVGATFMPPLFGLLGARFGYWLFPVYVAALLLLMVTMVYRMKIGYREKGGQEE